MVSISLMVFRIHITSRSFQAAISKVVTILELRYHGRSFGEIVSDFDFGYILSRRIYLEALLGNSLRY